MIQQSKSRSFHATLILVVMALLVVLVVGNQSVVPKCFLDYQISDCKKGISAHMYSFNMYHMTADYQLSSTPHNSTIPCKSDKNQILLLLQHHWSLMRNGVSMMQSSKPVLLLPPNTIHTGDELRLSLNASRVDADTRTPATVTCNLDARNNFTNSLIATDAIFKCTIEPTSGESLVTVFRIECGGSQSWWENNSTGQLVIWLDRELMVVTERPILETVLSCNYNNASGDACRPLVLKVRSTNRLGGVDVFELPEVRLNYPSAPLRMQVIKKQMEMLQQYLGMGHIQRGALLARHLLIEMSVGQYGDYIGLEEIVKILLRVQIRDTHEYIALALALSPQVCSINRHHPLLSLFIAELQMQHSTLPSNLTMSVYFPTGKILATVSLQTSRCNAQQQTRGASVDKLKMAKKRKYVDYEKLSHYDEYHYDIFQGNEGDRKNHEIKGYINRLVIVVFVIVIVIIIYWCKDPSNS